MKTTHATLVSALLLVLLQDTTSQAAEQRRSLRGSQGNRQVLRLTPGISKDPNRFTDRSGSVIEDLGGSDQTEAAVRRALDWFAKEQKTDGHWEETQSPIAHTGLVMLCYYSYGASHDKEGPYQETLKKALAWMLKKVGPEGQLMDGGRFYDHCIGTLALAEAYGASKDKIIEEPVTKAIKYLIRAQNPSTGGWRYSPYHIEKFDGDLSVSGWAFMAMASAQISDIPVSTDARKRGLAFLDRVSAGQKRGMYGYRTPRPSPSMTAEGMYAYELLAGAKKDPRLDESVKYLMTHLPDKEQENFYYWYYGTLSLRLYGGEGWEEWNSRMSPLLLKLQSKDGSWAPMGKRAKKEGRIVTTAWATLCLEVYYRYTPLGNLPPRAVRGMSLTVQSKPAGQPSSPFSRASTRPNSGRPQ